MSFLHILLYMLYIQPADNVERQNMQWSLLEVNNNNKGVAGSCSWMM